MSNSAWAIDASNITVEYRSPRYRYNTFKEYVFNTLRGRNQYVVHRALENVAVKVGKGEAVALIGHNGSGKSTLLRVLAGIIEPPGANLSVAGRVAPMIELGAGFDGELSGVENIFLSCTLMGLSNQEILKRLDGIVRFAELEEFIEMPFKNYSSGMQARLGFACATAVDPEIILADEVLAVGDSNFARKCLLRIEELRTRGTSLVLVSHDPGAVQRFCSRAYVFREGHCVFEGAVAEALEINERIMEKRYLAHLTPEEIEEHRRVRKLEVDAAALAAGGGSPRPKVTAVPLVMQRGSAVERLDVSDPFQLRFELEVEDSGLFLGEVTIGFALHTSSGLRLAGSNNKALGKELELANLRSETSKRLAVTFEFPQGVPEYCGEKLAIILGIHDQSLTRTIFMGEVSSLDTFNSKVSPSGKSDVLEIGSRCRFSCEALG